VRWGFVRLARSHIDLVVDNDANMGALCELHCFRAQSLRIHSSGQRHFVLGDIGADAEICRSKLCIGVKHGLNCFFQFGICGHRTTRAWCCGRRLRGRWGSPLVGSVTGEKRDRSAYRKDSDNNFFSIHEDFRSEPHEFSSHICKRCHVCRVVSGTRLQF